MASNTILQQVRELINTAGLALEDALEQIVPGADPAYWRRLLDRADQQAAPRKPRRRSTDAKSCVSTRSGKPRKTTNYAAQAVSRAMSGQLDRVNGRAGTTAPHGEDPDTRAILWTARGELRILEVR